MKYFITGATGFIGVNLAHKLAKDGHKVNALVRSKEKAKLLNAPNIEIYYGDIHQTDVLEKGIEGVDGIFHLSAFARPWAKDAKVYNKINAEGTKILYDIARKKQIPKIVHTSTGGTFGPSYNKPVNEETIRDIDFFNEYESTKFIAEKISKDYVIKGLDIVIVHPTRVYGPGIMSKSNAVTFMIKNYLKGIWRIIPGDGSKIGNYGFIDDVVNGHILAMEKGKAGEQYLLGGENASYEYFFKLVQQNSNKKYRLIKIPVWLLIGFAAIQMGLARMINKPPLLPPKWVKKYLYNWGTNSEKAVNELGYSITPLDIGIQKTIKWLKKNKS
ncbi:MAG: NAD-dependent epimerase/dehydratase family protein [Bacteroidota bacterium]